MAVLCFTEVQKDIVPKNEIIDELKELLRAEKNVLIVLWETGFEGKRSVPLLGLNHDSWKLKIS